MCTPFAPTPRSRYFTDLEPETLEQSRRWLQGVIAHNREQPRAAYNLAIAQRAERRAIGWIGIGRSSRYEDPRELGFGYMLNRDYWGRGYMTEAVTAILAFGFAFLGGRRASAWCRAENRASARVLEKAGLRLDREYEQADPKSGRPVRCLEYGMTLEEWSRRLLGKSSRDG